MMFIYGEVRGAQENVDRQFEQWTIENVMFN